MSRDFDLQQDVIDALVAQNGLDPADIGVAVVNGVVSLYGYVGTFAEKSAAERAVERVRGVKGLAEELKVRRPGDPKNADHEIAARLGHLLRSDAAIHADGISIKVENAGIMLGGVVRSQAERERVLRHAGQISGIVAVVDHMVVNAEEPGLPSPPSVHLPDETMKPGARSPLEGHQCQIGW